MLNNIDLDSFVADHVTHAFFFQITDGSVNRERLCLDFQPIQSESDCFDPYKWDHHGNNEKENDDKLKPVKSDSLIDG